MNRRYKRDATGFLSVAALLTAPALAEEAAPDPAITALTEPDSELDLGFGYVTDDNFHYGQYRGLTDSGAYGTLNLDLVHRNDASGTWLTLQGNNLALDSRSLEFEHTRQGDWGYFVDYAQIPRVNFYEHHTGLAGIGSNDLTINGEPTRDVRLETERKRVTLGGSKWFGDAWSVHVTARDDAKDGERAYGRGTGGAMEFLAEPIDQHIRQLEATLGYAGKKLQLSGGYYGTEFDNSDTALNITGGNASLANGAGAFTPLALPPDNQSHQLFIAGNYQFVPTVNATFKAAYAKATQDDDFILPSAPGRTNLGGRIDTTQLQLGVTARPMPKLSLLANLRYEDRDDKTPVEDYFVVTSTSTATGENEPRDIETIFGRLEASYYLPAGFRVTAGFDDEKKKRNTSAVRAVSFREETDEQSYRLELRRSISDTLTGEIAYVHSDRDGSEPLTNTVTSGALGSNLLLPIHLADRKRDKARLMIDWTPTEPLSVQLTANYAEDEYDAGRTPDDLGVRSGKLEFYSVDFGYAVSQKVQLHAWLSTSDNHMDQAACVNASSVGDCFDTTSSPTWLAQLRNQEDAAGLSLNAVFDEIFTFGADLQYSDITDEFGQQVLTPGATALALPDIVTRVTTATIFGRYAISPHSSVRMNITYDLYKSDDWTWSEFTYIDGTSAFNDPRDEVFFIGLSYTYRFQ
jgi:MtrB/PioB family decaheme-associated outer membrane protein